METFYLILLVPVVIALVAKVMFQHSFTWQEAGVQVVAVCLVVSGVWWAGKYSKTADTEIWNGEVTAKHRDHGSYVRTYSCHCYTTCSKIGKTDSCTEHCQTCYEDHYTVTWWLSTTIGNIGLDKLDRTSRSVYNSPDPPQYVAAYVSEPCSQEHNYTNYIKAVPESLFSDENTAALEQFTSLIPSYPQVQNYYHVNRVLPIGVPIDVKKWNDLLNEKQKKIGNSKEVNIIVVLVNTADQQYRYALEHAWLGGKKNDVIVTIGSSHYPNIDWVDAITLGQNAGNSLMTVTMRDSIMAVKTLESPDAVVNIISDVVVSKFDRKPMDDYAYLKDEITPPTWVIVLALVLSIVLSIGATWYFHDNDVFGTEQSRYWR